MEEDICLRDAQDAGKLKMQAITIILHLQLITYMHTASHAVRKEIERKVLEGL